MIFWNITVSIYAFVGICVRHAHGMAPHLQHLSVLRPVGAERPAAVGRLALRGGRHGQLVRQDGVSVTFLFFTELLFVCI